MESAEANSTYHDNELGKVMQQVGDKALAWAESLDLRPHHAVLFVILTITLKWLLYIIRIKAATRPPGPAFTVPLVGETLEYIRRPSTFIFKR